MAINPIGRLIRKIDGQPKSCVKIPPHDRAEGVGPHRNGCQIALIACAFARRDRFSDQRLRERHEAAAA
jgi:hypothetical protein